MMNKNTCYDLFRDIVINEKPLYDQKNLEQSVKFKMELANLLDTYLKLKQVLCYKAIQGKRYLQLKLKLIGVAKQVLLIHLEQGLQVYIPAELSQDSIPMSMRFYDPILKIIQEKCSDQRRDLFLLENHYTLK